jgi:hypothetical protein
MLTIFDSIRKEFSVNDKGESFCSRRAIARMTGKRLSTIQSLLQSIADRKQTAKIFKPFAGYIVESTNEISFELVFAIIQYYAFKGSETAQETLSLLTNKPEIKTNGKPRKIYTKYQKMKNGSFVYLIKNLTTGNLKIGYSNNPCRRFVNLQNSTDCELKLLAFFEGTVEDEQEILAKYINYNIRGEWFKPCLEIYLEFDLVNEVMELTKENVFLTSKLQKNNQLCSPSKLSLAVKYPPH